MPYAYEAMPVGSGPAGTEEGAILNNSKTIEDANDQAYGIQVQDRPPDGREHLGSSEKPGQPARVRPRPARRAPQEQALRLRCAAQSQAETARLLRKHFRTSVPRHLSGSSTA